MISDLPSSHRSWKGRYFFVSGRSWEYDPLDKDDTLGVSVAWTTPENLRKCSSSSSLSTHARRPERAQSPAVEAPIVLSSYPHSKSTAKAKSLLGGAVEQPLVVMPITVWNPPTKSARLPPRRA